MPGILVVEDDENLNRGITFSLKKSGYEVFSAESVKKAKRIASDHNVDVTICDVNLPDGNGLEFVRWMPPKQRRRAARPAGRCWPGRRGRWWPSAACPPRPTAARPSWCPLRRSCWASGCSRRSTSPPAAPT